MGIHPNSEKSFTKKLILDFFFVQMGSVMILGGKVVGFKSEIKETKVKI